jgi:hypothetical protein
VRTARRRGDHLAAYVGPWLGLEADVGVCFVVARNACVMIEMGSRVFVQSVGVEQVGLRSVVIVVGMLVCSNAAALNDCAVHRRATRQASQPSGMNRLTKLGARGDATVLGRLHVRRCRPQPPRYVAHRSFSPGSLIVVRLERRFIEQKTKSQTQSHFFSQDECDTSLQGYQRARLAVVLCFLLAFFSGRADTGG